MSVCVETADCFRVRNGSAWAEIFVRHGIGTMDDGKTPRRWVHLSVLSDFGDFGYCWSHIGGDWVSFLSGLEFDYAMGKLFGSRLHRERDLARAFWDDLWPQFVQAIQEPRPAARDERQRQVAAWCAAAFGTEHASSLTQRGIRLLEEAIEAYQAAGGEADMAHKLVDYVFGRPVGELGQELGGIGVTVLALAEAAGLSADAEEAREVARVLSKDLAHFTKRNEEKNAAGFNVTGAYPIANDQGAAAA